MKVELNKKSIQKSHIIILGGGQTGAYAANEIRKHDIWGWNFKYVL